MVLADELAAVNAQVLAFARGCSAADWVVVVPGEGWSVGVVLHHVAEGYALNGRWLESMAGGSPVDDTAEGIDAANAEHAWRAAAAGRDETVALLEENGARLEALLRALSDEQLDATAPFGPAGGRTLPAVQLAAVAARHPGEHLAHARAALGPE